jgi:hypothetical protein
MKVYHLKTFQDYESQIVKSLSAKGFLLITNSANALEQTIVQQIVHTETQNDLCSWFSHAIATLSCSKETLCLTQVFPENGTTCPVISEAEVLCFFQKLQANFPLSAIKFHNTCLSYLSWLNCDLLTADELILKVQQFVAAAQALKYIAERKTTSWLGINHSNEEYLIFSSLCLVFNDPGHFKALLPTVESIKFGNNSLPEFLFSGLKFLLTNVYQGSLFFDKVVYTSFDNQISSSQLIRGAGHFGCSLDDLAMK